MKEFFPAKKDIIGDVRKSVDAYAAGKGSIAFLDDLKKVRADHDDMVSLCIEAIDACHQANIHPEDKVLQRRAQVLSAASAYLSYDDKKTSISVKTIDKKAKKMTSQEFKGAQIAELVHVAKSEGDSEKQQVLLDATHAYIKYSFDLNESKATEVMQQNANISSATILTAVSATALTGAILVGTIAPAAASMESPKIVTRVVAALAQEKLDHALSIIDVTPDIVESGPSKESVLNENAGTGTTLASDKDEEQEQEQEKAPAAIVDEMPTTVEGAPETPPASGSEKSDNDKEEDKKDNTATPPAIIDTAPDTQEATPPTPSEKPDAPKESPDQSDKPEVNNPATGDAPSLEAPLTPEEEMDRIQEEIESKEIDDLEKSIQDSIEKEAKKWNPESMTNGLDILTALKEQYDKVSGKLDPDQLEVVDSEIWGRHSLHPEAAKALRALNEAFKEKFGENIQFTDSYRSFEQQVKLKEEKPTLAGTPGTSNHGWGLAVDFGSNINKSYETAEHKWMVENAATFGFILPEWAREFDEDKIPGKNEPWHWEYTGSVAQYVDYSKQKELQKNARDLEEKQDKSDKNEKKHDDRIAKLDAFIDDYKVSAEQKAFLKEMARGAIELYDDGAPISIEVMLAQSLFESGWGKSNLAHKYNNLFGMKAGSSWKGETVTLDTEEVINGKRVTESAVWRVYGSYAESMRDYAFTFIGDKSHYADAVANKDNPAKYLDGLLNKLDDKGNIVIRQGEKGSMSYATDPAYKEKMLGAIDIYAFDKIVQIIKSESKPGNGEAEKPDTKESKRLEKALTKMAEVLQRPQKWSDIVSPVDGEYGVSSGVGIRGNNNYHRGVDYPMPVGKKFYATFDGVITTKEVNTDTTACNNLMKSLRGGWPRQNDPVQKNVYLTTQVLNDVGEPKMVTFYYGHLSEFKVKNGQVVKAGDLIGLSGDTGCSTGPHAHLEASTVKMPGHEVTKDTVVNDINKALSAIKPGSSTYDVVTDIQKRLKKAREVGPVSSSFNRIEEDFVGIEGLIAPDYLGDILHDHDYDDNHDHVDHSHEDGHDVPPRLDENAKGLLVIDHSHSADEVREEDIKAKKEADKRAHAKQVREQRKRDAEIDTELAKIAREINLDKQLKVMQK